MLPKDIYLSVQISSINLEESSLQKYRINILLGQEVVVAKITLDILKTVVMERKATLWLLSNQTPRPLTTLMDPVR